MVLYLKPKNDLGHILGGTCLRRTQDLNLILIHKMDFIDYCLILLISILNQTLYSQIKLKTWYVLFWSCCRLGRLRINRACPHDVVCWLGSNKIFVQILLAFNSCCVILIEWTFYYIVICKCLSTIVRVTGTVQFTFFLVMRLNITIITVCDSFIVILVTHFFHH